MTTVTEELSRFDTLQSPITTLPPEVLSLIFQHACTTPDLGERHSLPELSQLSSHFIGKRPQFILGGVSVFWRQVLFSTPILWKTVNLVIKIRTLEKASAILKTFCAHSGELPLSINIRCTPSYFWRNADIPVDAALRRNASRIRELYLCDAPDGWIDFIPSLTNLTSLYIAGFFYAGRFKTQCLHLTLKSLSLHIPLHCPKVTILYLDHVEINVCFDLLLECSSLVEYKNRNPIGSMRDVTVSDDPLVYPHMEVFEWPVVIGRPADMVILPRLCMPALRKLVWVEDHRRGNHNLYEGGAGRLFFRNLPSSLSVLQLHDARFDSNQSTASAFTLIPNSLNVEHLIISYPHVTFLNHVFEQLTSSSNKDGSQRWAKLQGLRSIIIQGYVHWAEFNQDHFLQMLEQRFLTPGTNAEEPFLLDFTHKIFKMTWPPLFQQKLKAMVDRGLKMEFLEDSKPVDWL